MFEMRKFTSIIGITLLGYLPTFGQFSDNFSDKNFETTPPWSGHASKFEVDADEKLHLSAPAESSQAYLSTPSEAVANATWNFYVEISENPSSTNYTKIYLISNEAALDSPLRGYFVKVGGSTDEVSLYRQEGATEYKIIDGTDDRVDTKPVSIHIQVTRDEAGNWQLFTQAAGESGFTEEGSATDIIVTNSSYFGIYCQYTSTRSQAFFFDDFIVTGTSQPDEHPPAISSQAVLSDHQIALRFSEAMDSTSFTNIEYYAVNHQHPSHIDYIESDSLLLHFQTTFANGKSLSLSIENVQDTAGNLIQDTTLSLFYFKEVTPSYRDVVINELLPDPTPAVDSLPSDANAEFIELYNASSSPFNLAHWKINGKPLPAFILLPDEYLLLCRENFVSLYERYGSVLGLQSWPSLSNSGATIVLQDPEGQLIDSMTYQTEMVKGGYAIEQINPFRPCDLQNNYALSTHANGASPGATNAVYAPTADDRAPVLLKISALQADTLALQFDENIDITAAQIQLSPEIPIEDWWVDAKTKNLLLVLLSTPLSSQQHYTVSVSGVADCQGNGHVTQQKSFFFDDIPPEIVDVQWQDTARLLFIFNEKVEAVSATATENYTLSPPILAPKKIFWREDSASVELLFDAALVPQKEYSLRINQLNDLYGNTAHDNTAFPFILENHVDTVIIVNPHQLAVYFQYPPEISSAENEQHYWLDPTVGHPKAAFLDKHNDQILHLVFTTPFQENKIHSLAIADLYDTTQNRLSTPLYHFYYDTRPPAIERIEVRDATHLLVGFDEKPDKDLSTLQVNITSGPKVIKAEWHADGQSLWITLEDSLQNGSTYALTLSGIADQYGNTITQPKEKEFLFDIEPPALKAWKLTAPHQIKLVWDEPLEATTALFAENYSLTPLGNPDSLMVSSMHPGTVYLFFPAPIPEQATLTIQRLADQQGNGLAQSIAVKIDNTYPTIGGIYPFSDHKLQLTFSKVIEPKTLLPQHFLYDQKYPATQLSIGKDSSSVILTFDQPFLLQQTHTLQVPSVQDVSGNRSEGLTEVFAFDPFLQALQVVGSSTLQIKFKMPLQAAYADNIKNFEVPTLGNPVAVVRLDASTLQLFFEIAFEPQHLYQLHIHAFQHAENGWIPASQQTFGVGRTPHRFDLLITELMADPTPAVALPEAEFIEIHNPTDQVLSLANLTLTDGNTTAYLPNEIIQPGEYLILCEQSQAHAFATHGRTLPLTHFPSLNADADHLTLFNTNQEAIFSVAYTDEWYRDAEKKQGGWSLEMVDKNRPCGEMENWAASEDESGGSPGEENSMAQPNPDHFGPQVEAAWVIADSIVWVQFSEKVAPASLEPEHFILSEKLSVNHLQLLPNEKEVHLVVNTTIPAGKQIHLQVSQLTDCTGNLSANPSATITLVKPEEAEKGDILLSEILFAPRAGGVKFVEVYNASEKYIDLQNWGIARMEEDTVKEVITISQDHWILEPRHYLALTEDKTTLKADYPSTHLNNTFEVAQLPSLPVGGSTVALWSSQDSMLQSFTYSEALHHPSLKDTKGVSLERTTFEETESRPELWQSAASLVGFATPGYRNSQLMLAQESSAGFTVDPPVFFPDQTGFQDYTRIYYQFKEPGHVATIQIFDARGRKVKDLIQNQTLAQEGFLTWNGTDHQNKPVMMGYYIVLLEVYNPKGVVNVFKKKVVVGTRF